MDALEQKVLKFISEKKLISKGDRILIALSGGPDSVFLLRFLNKFKNKFKVKTGAAHFNHQLRPEADEDERFCKKTAEQLNIPFYTSSFNAADYAKDEKLSVEEAGRILRYNFFERLCNENDFNKIATAHNLDDNTETVLLNFLKGTGLRGVAGIPIKRNNIIRPILTLPKSEILNYLNYNKIDFRVDKSNFELIYQRNILREEIIPLIKVKLNLNLDEAVYRTTENLKEFSLFVGEIAEKFIKKNLHFKKKKVKIDIKELHKLNDFMKSEVIKKSLTNFFSVEAGYNDIMKIKELMAKNRGKIVQLTRNVIAYKESDKLIFSGDDKPEDDILPLKIKAGEEKKINGKTLSIAKTVKPKGIKISDKKKEYISADNLVDEFILRRWEKGEKFYPLGMKRPKKISDFLNELKIPTLKKKEQLVLTNQGRIVWVVNQRIDEHFKLTSKTKKIFKLCLK